MGKAQEYKSFSAAATKVIDADQGVVEHIVAVMGNIDRGDDVIHPGAFSKSITERGLKVKVLDQHDTRSVESVIGKPLELREVGRLELPPGLTDQYPDATGALVAKTQFLLDTNRGREAFSRIKNGAVDEYSIGYDPITSDYSTVEKDGAKKTVRNLREIRLWEYSPVVFGMNPATATLSAKEDEGEPDTAKMEEKPYRVYEEGGQYCVYKLNMDGEPTGESLGCHESAEEAQAQVAALYANEPEAEESAEAKAPMKTEGDGQHPASHYLVVEDAEKPSTWHLRVRNADGDVDHRLMGAAWAALHGGYRGNVYEGPGKREAIGKLTRLYASEDMDTPKEDGGPEVMVDGIRYVADLGDGPRYLPDDGKAGRVLAARNARRLENALATLTEILKDAGLIEEVDEEEPEEKEDHDAPVEPQAADDAPAEKEAGPVIPPTSERMALLRKLEIELLEVEK